MSEKLKSRWYQTEACDKILEVIKDKSVHPIAVVPTGAGKTHLAAIIIERYLGTNPTRAILVLSHVKEILEQNHKSLTEYMDEDIGLYSAMLKAKDIKRITVAGIQSIYKKSDLFENVGLILIDEAHLVTDESDGMYRKFLAEFDCNFIGLTATPFRARGYLHKVKNALFTDIAYDLSSRENFKKLIDQGYLSKLYSKGTYMKMDTTGIKMQAGDFNNKELNKKFNTEEVTERALRETIGIGKKYKKWLIFAISIEHAESIRDWLNDNNINTGIVHSKMDEDRAEMLDRFRSGFYKAMVNVNVLTTGLDIPDIDLIVMLRPTKSAVIYAQSVGRGLRVAEGKDHCLVLDFAGNVATHGPVDSIKIQQKGEKQKGEPVTKECPNCMAICHPLVKVCEACGHEFEFKVKIEKTASELDILHQEKKTWMNVNCITVNRHRKANKPDSVRIDYICGLRKFSQWAAVASNSGYAAHSAKYVINKFVNLPEDFEYTVTNILNMRDKFKTPKRIFVDQSENYPQIEQIEF